MKKEYNLKYFKSTKDPDLIKALNLYSKNIEPALRTDSKEIIYWVDRYNKQFQDSFYIIGFYLNEILIGFCELAYFVEERIIVVDYLVIDKSFRGNNTFFEFIDHIREFINRKNLIFDYIIAEIGLFNEKNEPPEKSKLIIRLLKISQFNVVKCRYYLPQLGVDNFDSEMRGVMMLYSLNEFKQIKKETFLQIVQTIYFKYHLRWYNAFLNDKLKIEYSRKLHQLIERIEKELDNKKYIEINGINNLFPYQLNNKSKLMERKITKVIVAIILLIISCLLVGGIYLFLKAKFGIEASEMSSILYISAVFVIFLLTILFEKKSELIKKIIKKIIDL